MPHRRKMPPRLLPPSHRPPAEVRSETKSQRRENVLYWCGLVCGLGAVATVVLATVTLTGRSMSASHATVRRKEGTLAITQSFVRNIAEESYAGASGNDIQTLASSPTVEMLLFNSSARHVLIEGATVVIESYAHVSLCFSQGGGPLPEPHPYVVRLPAFPLPSEDVVETHLHDEIDPENADRIMLRFDAPRPSFSGYGIYRLRIKLKVYNRTQPLNAGQFVLSTPAAIPPYDGYLPEDNSFFKQLVSGTFQSDRVDVTWCLRRNSASLASILSGPGKRSTELALLDHPVLASWWSQLETASPPRPAALKLLSERASELAVFAASKTGDPTFEKRVRARAVKQLLGEANKQLIENQPIELGEDDVREALALEPSSQGNEMLAEFERRLVSIQASRRGK